MDPSRCHFEVFQCMQECDDNQDCLLSQGASEWSDTSRLKGDNVWDKETQFVALFPYLQISFSRISRRCTLMHSVDTFSTVRLIVPFLSFFLPHIVCSFCFQHSAFPFAFACLYCFYNLVYFGTLLFIIFKDMYNLSCASTRMPLIHARVDSLVENR